MRRAYRALYRGEEFFGAVRARGDDVKNFGRRAVLLRAARAEPRGSRRPRGQRFCERRAAAIADGIRGRGAEADLDLAGRVGRITAHPEEAANAAVSKNERKDCRLRPSRRAFGAPQYEEKTERCDAITRSQKSA